MTKLRSSAITAGVQRAPNRAMLRAVGSATAISANRSSGSRTATVPSLPATPASTSSPSRGGPPRACRGCDAADLRDHHGKRRNSPWVRRDEVIPSVSREVSPTRSRPPVGRRAMTRRGGGAAATRNAGCHDRESPEWTSPPFSCMAEPSDPDTCRSRSDRGKRLRGGRSVSAGKIDERELLDVERTPARAWGPAEDVPPPTRCRPSSRRWNEPCPTPPRWRGGREKAEKRRPVGRGAGGGGPSRHPPATHFSPAREFETRSLSSGARRLTMYRSAPARHRSLGWGAAGARRLRNDPRPRAGALRPQAVRALRRHRPAPGGRGTPSHEDAADPRSPPWRSLDITRADDRRHASRRSSRAPRRSDVIRP